jgi:glycosyltransferase involved in cell wall biosynthesis/SAM-dependent methyltransferase
MLEWTGERYLPYLDPSVGGVEIHYEHLHRYAFASQFIKGKTVLDLASGEGYGSFLLAMHAKRVVGIDIDPASVDHASSTYVKDNLEFRVGSITDVPIEGEHIFDVIVCYEAIEHITEQEALLSEVKRLLKAKGIFIVSTPNKALYTGILANVNPFHKKELEYDEFVDLMNNNFAHVRIFGQNTLSGSRIFPYEVKKSLRSTEFLLKRDEGSFSFKEDSIPNTLYFIAIASDSVIKESEYIKSYLVDQSNTEIAFLSDKISKNNGIIQSLQQHVNGENQKILELSALQDTLNQTLAAKEQHIQELASHQDSLNQTLAAKEQRVSELTSHQDSLNQTLAAKEQLVLELTSHQDSLNQTLAAKEQLVLELTSHQDSLNQALAAKEQIVLELASHQNTLKQVLAEKEQLVSELASHQDTLNKTLAIKEQHIQELASHRDSLNQTLAEKEQRVSELAFHQGSLNQILTAKEQLVLELASHQETLKQALAEKEWRVSELASHQNTLNQTLAEKEQLVLELASHQNTLNQTLAEKEQLILELASHQNTLNQTLAEKEKLVLELVSHQETLKQALAEKEQRISELASHRNSQNQALTAKEQQIQKLASLRNSLNQTLTAKEQQIQKLASVEDTLHKTLAAKEQEINRLKSNANYLKGENESLKSSISYRILNKFHKKIIEPCFPHNTRRREFYDHALKGGRIVANEGIGKAISEYKRYRISRKNQRKDPEIVATSPVPPVLPASPAPSQPHQPSQSPAPEPKKPEEDPVPYIFSQMNTKSPEYVPFSESPVHLTKDDIRFIAFYLPQFHPIPENDLWWGKGFTEWTNVTKALPQFIGHYQPHRPDDLGYYDLRLPEVQKRQVELAKHYGIYGFCFYYYWFNGKRLLERPINQYLEHKEFDLPFCICWANENWTRRWDGMDSEILISQSHNAENDIRFIHDVEPILRDPRYIRIDGKPLLIVYRATLLPEPVETVKRWRAYCRQCGIGEIYLIAALCFGCSDPTVYGFDAAIEFPPHTMWNCENITKKKKIINPNFSGTIFDYEEFVYSKKYLYPTSFKLFKTVSPGWDNTPRRPNHASIFTGATPYLYKEWLRDVSKLTRESHPDEEHIVFINAWNEWAEGTHLEPDQRFGYGYLQATSEVVTEMHRSAPDQKKIIIVSHDAHLHGAQMLTLHLAKALNEQFHYEVHLLLKSGGRLEEDFRKYSVVYNLERDYSTPQSVDELIRSLSAKNITVAICNTVVSGDILEILSHHGIRTISLIHELPGVIRQFGQEENVKKISRCADKVVFPSEYVKKHFLVVQHVDEAKCKVAPQGLFLKNRFRENRDKARTLLRQKLSLPKDACIILNIGYADYRKAPDIFVEVAKTVIKHDKNVYFVWVGLKDDTFMKPVDAEIKQSGIKNNIIFPGLCTDDIDVYYTGADIFLLTSREDPFPSVVLDAMNAGLPVIGFDDVGGFKDIVSGKTGVLVPCPAVDKMSDALIRLLDDPDLRIGLGRNAAELIETKFNFTDYVFTLLGFLGHHYKKVSVVLPSYNYEKYLPERLNSIVRQNYPIYEIIALDDCSSDRSVDIIRDFAQQSPVRIKISVNTSNSGSAFRQWAKGIALTTGDYIWVAEADDLSEPRFLETVMEGFNDDEVVLSYTQSYQMDEAGTVIADNYLEYTRDIDEDKWKGSYIRKGTEEIQDSLVIKNTIPNVSAVVFKKTDISGILDDLVKLKIAGDWYFYTWLLAQGKIAYTPAVLNYHRRHGKSITKIEHPHDHFNEIVFMQDYIINRFEIDDRTLEKVIKYRNFVKNYLLGSDTNERKSS